jgi:predicted HTH transcriptional regulator
MFGVERSTVARAIAKLKRSGVLRRIGPDKGGHWEVIEKLDE